MRRSTAALGSAAFFVAAPGVVAGLVPWLLTGWELHRPAPYWWIAQVAGALLVAGGLVPVVHAFTEFAKAGGTPMPLAPTRHLVVTGFNRYVRNPMYVGVLAMIVGQAMLFGRLSVLVYAALAWLATAAFVRWYEEPTLRRTYGSGYEAYRRAVPAWWPRRRAWAPPATDARSGDSAQV
jgi:protein-S-isoprenylcysteine O-methyltransferase Ste14